MGLLEDISMDPHQIVVDAPKVVRTLELAITQDIIQPHQEGIQPPDAPLNNKTAYIMDPMLGLIKGASPDADTAVRPHLGPIGIALLVVQLPLENTSVVTLIYRLKTPGS